MKNSIYFCLLGALLSAFASVAQKNPFFPDQQLIQVGVYYYPEHWPESQWERDLSNIRKMGFEFTHFAEFAWSQLEPTEGNYRFEWLDKAIDIAHKNGLKVIMCTPTPTPPVWLSQKHPEILVKRDYGLSLEHGSRQHASWSSAIYKKYIDLLVRKMAEKYGHDPRIMGWQIDNEPSHYGPLDYSSAAQQQFRVWLQKKYKTIDALNEAWGTAFWSLTYQSFEQITAPNIAATVQGVNPHALLDFKRFSADECAQFVSFQKEIIQKYATPNQFITTNFMHYFPSVDPWRNKDLDFTTYTVYPINGNSNGEGEQGFRVGEYWRIPYSGDFFRSIRGYTGVMELQIGQVNWGNYQPRSIPGTIRAYLFHSYAVGCKLSCSYRFRQPLSGYELYIEGMVGPDGVSPTVGGAEYMQAIQEIKTLRKSYQPGQTLPARLAETKTAILWNFDNAWDIEYQKQNNAWNTEHHVIQNYYMNLKKMGLPVDFIDEQKDLNAYPFLIAPAYQLVDQGLVNTWKKYVEQGGHLVLSCRTAQKDRYGRLWEQALQGPILPLIGGKIEFYDHIAPNKNGKIKFGEQTFLWNNWADVVSPDAGTETWASFQDVFYAGKAAVTHKIWGKGSVTFIGADTDDGELEASVLERLYIAKGKSIQKLPQGVFTEWRDGFTFYVNYSEKPYEVPVPTKAKILIGKQKLSTSEVLIYQEK